MHSGSRLAAETTSFVDRRQEVAEVKRLLSAARLVTLTGPGGSGKTRLAVRVAGGLRRAFADGVWQVDLAPVADGSVVEYAVIEALGVRSTADVPATPLLAAYLRDRVLLLILDSCEHLLDECAALVVPLLRAASGLRVLCTSRQPLGVVGESVFPVPPLPVPDSDAPMIAAEIDTYAAVQLFAQRAAAVVPGFVVTVGNRRSVVEICGRLDGLPLSIELAAAQVRTRSVEQVAAGLGDGWRMLSVRHAVPAHHRGVWEAFDWSFAQCSPTEQALWARVAIFAGSFDSDAAVAVCAGEDLAPAELPDLLACLVDKSILLRDERSGRSRYRLLETVREYGLVRLRAAGDLMAVLHRRYRDWYLGFAREFSTTWFGPDQKRWLARARAEQANLRALLGRCLANPGEVEAGLQLAADLYCFWWASGGTHEIRYWLDRALRADPSRSAARVAALSAYSTILSLHGSFAAAEHTAQECLTLARKLDVPLFVARALNALGTSLMHLGDLPGARAALEEAMARLAELGRVDTEAAMTRSSLAMIALIQGDPAGAAAMCAQVAADCQARGDRWWQGYAFIASALVALAANDLAGADRFAQESLRLRYDLDDTLGMAGSLERLAWIAAATGDMPRAAQLLGVADRMWRVVDRPLWGSSQWLRGREKCEATARGVLGDTAFEAALRRGAELGVEEAVRYALNETYRPGGGPARPAAPAVLTRRESQIAELLAQGLSNKQIAARLVISPRTAETHVENILCKLEFTSRTQVAIWVAQCHDGDAG